MKKKKLCDDCGKRPAAVIRTVSRGKGKVRHDICHECTEKTANALVRAIRKAG